MALFATSHGKNACDGVGGIVKRQASLQARVNIHIFTPRNLYDWSTSNIRNVKFFFVSKEDIQAHTNVQQGRFATAKSVPGTISHHCFQTTAHKKLVLRRISGVQEYLDVDILTTPIVAEAPRGTVVESQAGM